LLSLAVVFGILMASRIYIQERVHHGVVVAVTTSLREGPERSAKEIMQVHEGLKVRLLNEVGDHTRVRLANGVEGFLQDSHLGRI
jgi:SH3-like domain-containing protein